MPTVQRRARQRAQARADRLNVQAKYDAAGTGRRMASWTPSASGPIRAQEGVTRLRSRSHDTIRNDWAARSSQQKWVTNLVGVGITPRWANDEHTERFAEWVPECDADNVLDFYAMQALGARGWFSGGEVFLRRRPRSLFRPLAAPVQVQLLESDFCPHFDADAWQGMPLGHEIRQGIEFTRSGERVAYWMHRTHPGDGMRLGSSLSLHDLVRVRALDIGHVFEPDRPGAIRGVGSLAPIMAKLRASMNLEDAVLDRQQIANLFTMFLTRALPENWADLELDDKTGLPTIWSNANERSIALQPGVVHETVPGEDVKFSKPPDAGVSFPDYMRTNNLGTSAGAGLPYELMTGDGRDVSDRVLRVLLLEFRRFCQQRQWHMLIPMMCQKMVNWWAESLVLRGDYASGDLKALRKAQWFPQGWEHIHPVQDPEGKILEIEAGLRARSDVISERGDDPKIVQARRKLDAEADEADGLTPEPKPAAPAAPKDENGELREMLREQAALTTALLGTVNALLQRQTAGA